MLDFQNGNSSGEFRHENASHSSWQKNLILGQLESHFAVEIYKFCSTELVLICA